MRRKADRRERSRRSFAPKSHLEYKTKKNRGKSGTFDQRSENDTGTLHLARHLWLTCNTCLLYTSDAADE